MKKQKKFADGGSSETPDSIDVTPDAQIALADNNPQQTDNVPPQSPDNTESPDINPVNPLPSTQQNPNPSFVIPPPPSPPTTVQYNAEDMKEAQDAASRQITPKTYSSMFQDKSTLGKIGTIFGMLLSGAGSGLAHQPNMLMQMMDNQIKNDLDAQKSNVSNEQNFLNINFAHELQQAQIRRADYENQLSYIQGQKVPYEIAQTQAATLYQKELAKGIPADIALKNVQAQLAKAQMGIIAPQIQASLAAAKASEAAAVAQQAQTEKTQVETAAGRAKAAALISALNPNGPTIGQSNQIPQQPGVSPPNPTPANQTPLPPTDQMPVAPQMTPFPHPDDVKHAAFVAPFRAENQMRTAVGQYLTDVSANNPQAQAVLQNTVLPAIAAKNADTNAQLDAAQNLIESQKPQNQDVVTDRNLLNQKIALHQIDPSIPGSIDRDTASKEIAALENKKQLYATTVDAFKQLANLPDRGQMNPYLGSLLKAGSGLAGAITAALGGGPAGAVGSGAVAGAGASTLQEYLERKRTVLTKILIQNGIDPNAVLPSRADKTEDLPKVWEAMNKAFAISNAGLAPNLDSLGLKAPFPFQAYQAGDRGAAAPKMPMSNAGIPNYDEIVQ